MRNILVATVLVMVPSVAFAQGIIGSPHDLSNGSGAPITTTNTDGRVCVFCHVPHNANPAVNGVWNRDVPAVPFTWTNTSPTIGGTALPAAADAQSVRCFTCHDGSTNIGVLYNGTTYTMTGADQTGGVLNNPTFIVDNTAMDGNHPVSVAYPNPVNVADYNGTTTGAAVATAEYQAAPTNARIYTDASNDRGIECGSCHDPHDGTTNTYFLRDSLSGSALCLNCHIK